MCCNNFRYDLVHHISPLRISIIFSPFIVLVPIVNKLCKSPRRIGPIKYREVYIRCVDVRIIVLAVVVLVPRRRCRICAVFNFEFFGTENKFGSRLL